MAEETRRNQDMILAPNEYALITDETKGEISAYVGPNKTSLAGSDRPVVFDRKTQRFRGVSLDAAIQPFQTAPEGSYNDAAAPVFLGAAALLCGG